MIILKNKFLTEKIHPLVKNNYAGRIVYCGIAILIGIPMLIQFQSGFQFYVTLVAISLLWPHIAFIMAYFSRNSRWFEQYININLDPLIFGIWIPFFQFNPLMALIITAIVGSVGILSGGGKIFITRTLSFCIAIIIGTLLFGFKFNPESSLIFILSAGLSIILITFTSAFISYNTYCKFSDAKKILKHQKYQMEMLSSKLSKYLSPQIYNSIFTGKKDVRIETSRKKLTIFFSDIQNFTMTTDSMEAEDLSTLLNNYLNEMTGIAIKYGGTIDKYIGDAIMIFFGDPETRGEQADAISCVSMAIEMRERMTALREQWNNMGIVKPLHIRIGINTGFCTVGNFGSDERLDYTVIGGQVNLASRLESNAEPNQILISTDTFLLIKNVILCKEMGEIPVKGMSRPVMTYKVIDFHEKTAKRNDILKEDIKGVSVKIDFRVTEPGEAAGILKEIISRIEK